jgi:hypothetical protein
MFQTAAYSKSLRFNSEFLGCHVAIYIAGAVTCGQYYRSHECALLSFVSGIYADYTVAIQYEAGHQGLKVDLTAAVYYGVADVFNHARQAVSTYVRVCIGQYRGACAVLAEYVQDAVGAAAFLASGVELAVGICSCAALTETVVGLGVYLVGAAYGGYVDLAVVHVFAALKYYGAQTEFNQVECCKETAGAGANHNHGRFVIDRAVFNLGVLGFGRLLVYEYPQGQVYKNGALAGVDALLESADGRDGAHVEPALP